MMQVCKPKSAKNSLFYSIIHQNFLVYVLVGLISQEGAVASRLTYTSSERERKRKKEKEKERNRKRETYAAALISSTSSKMYSVSNAAIEYIVA